LKKNATHQTEICKKASPKNKQILIETSPKTSNPKVFKKIANPQKSSPNSRENRKIGNIGGKTQPEANY